MDQDLKIYNALNFKKFGYLNLPGLLISKETRRASSKANSEGITGDIKGNGLQAGGTYVVEKGGKVLFEYKQARLADHPKMKDILDSLGVSAKPADDDNKPSVQCDENACKL